MVWSCFPFIRSGQIHFARHSERGKTKQTEEEVGRQHQAMDRPGVRQVPEGSGGPGKMEKTGCKTICGAPTTLAVKRLMMMMMMMTKVCMRKVTYARAYARQYGERQSLCEGCMCIFINLKTGENCAESENLAPIWHGAASLSGVGLNFV